MAIPEDLYRADTDPQTLANQINDVRGMLWSVGAGAVKVGHVDTWTAWVNPANTAVIYASDFIGTDGYPYFQDSSINDAYNVFWKSVSDVGSVVAQIKPEAPIWITETGWPVSGGALGAAMPSVNNARMYWESVGCEYIADLFLPKIVGLTLKQVPHLQRWTLSGIPYKTTLVVPALGWWTPTMLPFSIWHVRAYHRSPVTFTTLNDEHRDSIRVRAHPDLV